MSLIYLRFCPACKGIACLDQSLEERRRRPVLRAEALPELADAVVYLHESGTVGRVRRAANWHSAPQPVCYAGSLQG